MPLSWAAVVHGHAPVGSPDGVVDHDGHALVGAVLGRLVVYVRRPVVGKVLVEGAAGAGGYFGDIG